MLEKTIDEVLISVLTFLFKNAFGIASGILTSLCILGKLDPVTALIWVGFMLLGAILGHLDSSARRFEEKHR